MTNPKHNGNGNADATTQPKNGTAVKPAVPKQLTEAEKAELERKAQLEAQRQHFNGLHRLTTMRQRCEEHKLAVEELTIDAEEVNTFDDEKRYGVRIALFDNDGRQYVINHAKLVKEVQDFLITRFNGKIAECEDKILNYGK